MNDVNFVGSLLTMIIDFVYALVLALTSSSKKVEPVADEELNV